MPVGSRSTPPPQDSNGRPLFFNHHSRAVSLRRPVRAEGGGTAIEHPPRRQYMSRLESVEVGVGLQEHHSDCTVVIFFPDVVIVGALVVFPNVGILAV